MRVPGAFSRSVELTGLDIAGSVLVCGGLGPFHQNGAWR